MSSRYPINPLPRQSVPPPSKDSERRILVIDDNTAIHRDFRKILCPPPSTHGLAELDEALFGTKPDPDPRKSQFVVDAVGQGREGLEAIRHMQKMGRPYALAFVDMRMPPGWDGVETLEHIWFECPKIEAVICSAYSDYSWHEVIRRLQRPGLRLLSKPFASRDVLEFAWSLTARSYSIPGGGSRAPGSR
jgi:CheY-like chemotaxis protein